MKEREQIMVDSQTIESFTDCINMQSFMQNYQEEKVRENQMFYKYLSTQLQLLQNENEEEDNQKKQKLNKSSQNNQKNQPLKGNPSSIKRSRFIDLKNVLDIYLNQNLIHYLKWKEILKIFKDKLNHVHAVMTNKNHVYEIDLESQETRILVRDQIDFFQDMKEQKYNPIYKNYSKVDDSFDSLIQENEEDFKENMAFQRNNKNNCNFIDADFGIDDINTSEQSFANSINNFFQGVNNSLSIESNRRNQILEQKKPNQKKQQIIQPFFFEDGDDDNSDLLSNYNIDKKPKSKTTKPLNEKQSTYALHNDRFVIEIESKEDDNIVQSTTTAVAMELEQQQVQPQEQQQLLKYQDKQNEFILESPQKSREKNLDELTRGPITRSASKKLALFSPEQNQKNQSPFLEKSKSANIWNDSNNKSMNDAICITNSIEQDISQSEDTKFFQQEFFEINSKSISPTSKQIFGQKERQIVIPKKIVKKETNTQQIASSLNNNNQSQQQNENLQQKQNIQIIRKEDMEKTSIKLNDQNSKLSQQNNSNQNQQIMVKKEFVQPISRTNGVQCQSQLPPQILKNQNNNNTYNKLIKEPPKQKSSQMEIEKDVIIISPLDTNIQSLSRISSQLSLNNSCYIVREKKLGKKITKANKSSPNSNFMKEISQQNSNSSSNQAHQSNLKTQKRKIIRN